MTKKVLRNCTLATSDSIYMTERMHELGVITNQQYVKAVKTPIRVKQKLPQSGCVAAGRGLGFFCEYVRQAVAQGSDAFAKLLEELPRPLLAFWNTFDPYQMNTLLVNGDTMVKLLKLSQLQDAAAGQDFHGTGRLVTPMGAQVLRSSAVPAGKIIGLDRNYALELVKAGDVLVEYDKIIDRQLERAAITTVSGFAKIFPEASGVLSL